jgi:hypothetical protein
LKNGDKSRRVDSVKHAAAQRVVLFFVACVTVGALSACHSGSSGPTGPTASIAPTATAAIGQVPATSLDMPASAFAKHKPFTGPAVAKFGQANVEAAFHDTVNFAYEMGWNPVLLRRDHTRLTIADLASVRSVMTPSCRAAFDATIAKVIVGDKAAIAKLEQTMSFGVSATGGLKPVTSGKAVTNRRFSDAKIAIDRKLGHDRLAMAFTADANIEMQNAAGAHYTLPTSRKAQFWLVPNAGADRAAHPLLIDGWAVKLAVRKPTQSS